MKQRITGRNLSPPSSKDDNASDVISANDIQFDLNNASINNSSAIQVDLQKCKQHYAATQQTVSVSSVTKVQTNQRLFISDTSDLTTNLCVDLSKKLVHNCVNEIDNQAKYTWAERYQATAKLTSTDPVIPLDTVEQEIPEEMPAPTQLSEEPSQAQNALSKKKQAKADKKKEAKQNAKLKAQQMKQKEAELKAEKEKKRKEM